MTDLRSFFDAIDLEMIYRFIREGRQENLHLEFRVLSEPGDFTRYDRRNLAKTISGFANSDGGVIVWGVVARRDDQGLNAASGTKPIENVRQALSQLESLIVETTSPPVEGIDHMAILESGERGFLVTYVPASDSGPHMAKLGTDRYYKRSGSIFYRMEHFDVADMFGRRRKPALTCCATDIVCGERVGNIVALKIVVGVRNDGRGMARFPSVGLSVSPCPPYNISGHGLDGNGRTGLPRHVSSNCSKASAVYAGGADDVVHVNSLLEVTTVEVEVSDPYETPPDLILRYRLSAEDARSTEGQCTVAGEKVLAAIRSCSWYKELSRK